MANGDTTTEEEVRAGKLPRLVELEDDQQGLNPSIRDINQMVSQLEGAVRESEAAVLSSEAGKREADKVQDEVDTATAKAAARDERAAEVDAQRQEEDTPTSVEGILAEDDENLTPEQRIHKETLAMYKDQKERVQEAYDKTIAAATQAGSSQISLLKQKWEQREQELRKFHKGEMATWQTSFTRTGMAEYSPGMTANFTTAKEEEQLQEIMDLDAEYSSKIAQARQDIENAKITAAAEKAADIQQIESNMIDVLQDHAETVGQANKEIRVNDAVIKAYQGGLQDVESIYQAVRNQGIDITLQEVDDIVSILDPPADMTGLSTDYRTYKRLQEEGQIGEDIPYTQYIAMIDRAESQADGGDTPTDVAIREFEEYASTLADTYMDNKEALDDNVRKFIDSLQVEKQIGTRNQLKRELKANEQLKTAYENQFGVDLDAPLSDPTPSNESDLEMAGLSGASARVQSYFLNTENAFQRHFNRLVARGEISGEITIDDIVREYNEWKEEGEGGDEGGGGSDQSAFKASRQ